MTSATLPSARRARARHTILAAAIAVLIAMTPSAVLGEADPGLGGLDESSLFAEIPSVYAASKYAQKTTEAPSAVSIVTRSEIQRFGYRTLSDVLAGLPGIFMTNDRNYDYLALRGFGRAGDYNSRVLVMIDGHRVNDAIYGSAPIGTDFPVDIDLIERIEVVRGASSALHGSAAFLGVINVITTRGRDLQGTEVTGGAGSQETYLARLSHGRKLDNGFEFLLSGTYYESEGENRLFFSEFNDPATNNGIVRNADGDTAYRLFANLSYREWTLQAGFSYREKIIPTASFETIFGTDQTATEDDYLWADLSYETEFGDGWLLSARTNYDRYIYYGDYLYNYGTTAVPDIVLNRDEALGDRWGGEAEISKQLFERHRASAAIEFDYNFRQDQSNEDVTPRFTYLNSKKSSVDFAVYAQDEIRVFDVLRLNLGVRYDHDGDFGGSVNPRVAVIYTPQEATSLKLLYGSGYRAPTAYELFYSDGGSFLLANPDLDPETIQTVEFVVEQQLFDGLRLSASTYWSEIDDLIEQVEIAPDVNQFQNLSGAEAFGLEALVDKRWSSGLEASVSYAIQRAESKSSGVRLTNSPKHLVQIRMSLPLIADVLTLNPEVRYISRRKTANGGMVDDAVTADLTLHMRDWIPGLELQSGVMNLLDARNFDPASIDHVQNAIEQNGRTYFVKVGYRF